MYYLFLDDERQPTDVKWVKIPHVTWTIVRNYEEFIKTIKEKGVPRFVSFDHDLHFDHYRVSMYNPDKHYNNYYTDGTFKEKTGRDAALWLANYCIENKIPIPEYTAHTMNPLGKENIISIMESAKRVQNV